jgi:ribonucleoside-diphosphate reductase beta chain
LPVSKKLSPIFQERDYYKPFAYPWAYDLWDKHESIHWLRKEVPLHEDIRDWNNKLTPRDRNFLTDIFLLFTQSEVDVGGGYVKDYLPKFHHPELRMMLGSFLAAEARHMDAYSGLIETVGMKDSFYRQFIDVPVMKAKHDFFAKVVRGKLKAKDEDILPKIAGISACTEGMQLFSSFAMLMNFPRQNLMKGMGQIVTWSVLDEQLHVRGLTQIYNTIVKENPAWVTKASVEEIRATAEMMAELEFDLIDLAYQDDKVFHGLMKKDLKLFIRHTTDKRLRDLHLPEVFGDGKPLLWFDELIGSQNHENFFEARATSYAKGQLRGSWSDIWGQYNKENRSA